MDSSTFHEKFNHYFSAISFFGSRATKEAVTEFKLQTDFLFRHSFGDNEVDEINHMRLMMDRAQDDSSLFNAVLALFFTGFSCLRLLLQNLLTRLLISRRWRISVQD